MIITLDPRHLSHHIYPLFTLFIHLSNPIYPLFASTTMTDWSIVIILSFLILTFILSTKPLISLDISNTIFIREEPMQEEHPWQIRVIDSHLNFKFGD